MGEECRPARRLRPKCLGLFITTVNRNALAVDAVAPPLHRPELLNVDISDDRDREIRHDHLAFCRNSTPRGPDAKRDTYCEALASCSRDLMWPRIHRKGFATSRSEKMLASYSSRETNGCP